MFDKCIQEYVKKSEYLQRCQWGQVYLLCRLYQEFQAYIAARLPPLAEKRKTNEHENMATIQTVHCSNEIQKTLKVSKELNEWDKPDYFLKESIGRQLNSIYIPWGHTHLSVRVFYCRVIFFHKDSLHKLNCLQEKAQTKSTITQTCRCHVCWYKQQFKDFFNKSGPGIRKLGDIYGWHSLKKGNKLVTIAAF